MSRKAKEDYSSGIIDAAVARLLGGERVTVAALARDLKISTSLVHFYWRDRASIVTEAWRRIIQSYVAADQLVVAGAADADLWEPVRDLVEQVYARDRDAIRRAHVHVSAEAQTSPEMAELVARETRIGIDGWATVLQTALDLGVIETDLDLRAVAALLIGVPLGFTVLGQDFSDAERDEIARVWYTMIRSVLLRTADNTVPEA